MYRKRRDYISKVALDYKFAHAAIPTIEYNKDEVGVWNYCYPKLKKLLATNACEETNWTIKEMEENIEGFGPNSIP